MKAWRWIGNFTLAAVVCCAAATSAFALGGPVIIGGDDADDHGSFSSGANQTGWRYIQSGFDVIGPCVDNGNKVAVCIGCNGGRASGGFQSGFDQSTLPGAGWTRVSLVTSTEIANFFNGSGTVNVNNSGILYMPTDAGNVTGGITSSQLSVVNANAAGINTFVTNGGGLFTHDQQFQAGGFAWLSALLPGLVVNAEGACNDGVLNLTAEGQAQFPTLTDALLSNATPWHGWFSGNFGGLDVLVTGPCPGGAKPVILGGCQVVIQSNIELDPELDFNPPGSSHTVLATVKNDLGAPVPGVVVTFTIVSGPNAGASGVCSANSNCETDASGQVSFTYTSNGTVGVDIIEACFVDNSTSTPQTKCTRARKFWDLDCNENAMPDSCDISCAGYNGECRAYSPNCGGSSDADGNGVPDECNRPPVCDKAVACEATLWPPNHKYRPISICGVTDPDGDPVTITVTSITQDEPINTRGDGNTCPDGQIVDGQALVRAERTGTPGIPGNGRVYAIGFTADDGQGGQCTGTVFVCVPHDMGGSSTCVDDGQRYNSLGSCTSGGRVAPEALSLKVGVAGTQANLSFALPEDAFVDISVFDVSGRRVSTIERAQLGQGVHERSWNMDGLSNGMYFVRMNVGGAVLTRTVVRAR